MALAPVAMSGRELRALIAGMAELTGELHSFEGNVSYSAWNGPACTLCGADPEDDETAPCSRCEGSGCEPLPEGAHYWVSGVIRDNSDGSQGFVRIVGTMLDSQGRPLGDLSVR